MPVNIINGGSNNNNAAKDAVNSLNEILHDWEEVHDNNGMDPVPHLVKLCDLFELHTNNFLKKVRRFQYGEL